MGFMDDFRRARRAQKSGKNFLQHAADESARKRQEAQAPHTATEAEVRAYLREKERQYNEIVKAERARGNGAYPEVRMTDGWLGDCRAVIRFNMNGDKGRVDIFYGGTGNDPIRNDDHGHVCLRNGEVISWLEPGQKGQRSRLY